MSLYNKMRPISLADVRGQDKIIKILLESLNKKNIPNAMLFIGTRGTGKTTVAKIVARWLNCETPKEDGSCCDECASCKAILNGSSLDVLELDAASNNGVDNVRSIIESVSYKAVGKMKIVILDEVHMLSTGAFNALLKIMEEPPKNVLFILCTTELHKIPATIVSRCRKFQFETINEDVIVEKLRYINQVINKEAEEDALYLVAKAAKGSMRDAESIYEAFIDTDGIITAQYVRDTLGFTSEENVFAILDAIVNNNPAMADAAISNVVEKGHSLGYLVEECFHAMMDVISLKMNGVIDEQTSSEEYVAKISDYAFAMDINRLFEITDALQKAYEKRSHDLSMVLHSMLIGLACKQSAITDLQNRVSELEQEIELLKKGVVISSEPQPTPEDCMENTSSLEEVQPGISEETADTVIEEEFAQYAGDVPFAEQEESIPSVPEHDNAPQTSALSAEALQELAECGFSVATDAPVFDEEELREEMLEEDTSGAEPSNSQQGGYSEETDTGASFFDDFARLFQM